MRKLSRRWARNDPPMWSRMLSTPNSNLRGPLVEKEAPILKMLWPKTKSYPLAPSLSVALRSVLPLSAGLDANPDGSVDTSDAGNSLLMM